MNLRCAMSFRRTRAGFSLIEVMVAVAVLAIALVGLARGLTTALGSSREGAQHTDAVLLATSQIEALRAEYTFSNGTTDGTAGPYRWTQTISPAGVDGLHQVQVEVQTTDGAQQIYSLVTYLYQEPDSLTSRPEPGSAADKKRRRKGGQP
jgi:general secretion pathway protein I